MGDREASAGLVPTSPSARVLHKAPAGLRATLPPTTCAWALVTFLEPFSSIDQSAKSVAGLTHAPPTQGLFAGRSHPPQPLEAGPVLLGFDPPLPRRLGGLG